jgi:very-short-patch-repair endonuclease
MGRDNSDQEDDYSSDSEKIDYSAKLIESEEIDRDLSYSFEGLLKAGLIFNFGVYAIYEDSRGKFYDYGILLSDLRKIHKFRVLPQDVLFNGEAEEFVFIDDDLINCLEKKIEVVNVYILQRLLWPDMYLEYKKMEEFEITFNLNKNSSLSSLCYMTPQQTICGYRADCLFTLKSTILDPTVNVPDVVLEIDENGHKDRSEEEENKRQKFIESLGHRFHRIPVKKYKKADKDDPKKRKKIYKELANIANETAEKLKMIISDLNVEYTPGITAEKLVEMAEEFDVDKELVKIYYPVNKKDNDSPFFIHHEIIGKYLGYSDDTNGQGHKYLKELINKKLVRDIDYEIRQNFPSGVTDGKKKRGGSGKKHYMLSRVGFYKTCLASNKPKAYESCIKIVKMYDCVSNYVKKLRAQLIKNTPLNCKERVKYVEERIKYKKDINEEKRLTSKLKEENNELKDENSTLKEKIKELETIVNQNKTTIRDLVRQNDKYFAQGMYKKRKKEGLIYHPKHDEDSSSEEEVEEKVTQKKPPKVIKKSIKKEGDSDSDDDDHDELVAKYQRQTVVQLKKLCKDNCLSGYHKKSKADLIEFIIESKK